MKYLFSAAGRNRLRQHSLASTLFAFDYDGTLTEIVQDRAMAYLSSSTRQWLVDLGSRSRVAIISGRSLPDLRKRIPPRMTYLVGNHGGECAHFDTKESTRSRLLVRDWIKMLALGISEKDFSGIEIENKNLSITLHLRKCRRPALVARKLQAWIASFKNPPKIITGKLVLNLIPQFATLKGEALLKLLKASHLPSAIYFGDDDTDEEVFKLSSDRITCVRVGYKRSSAAPFYLKSQKEIDLVLKNFLGQSA